MVQDTTIKKLLLHSSYETYKKSVEAGDDGKENFHARKACEYLKMAVEVTNIMILYLCVILAV